MRRMRVSARAEAGWKEGRGHVGKEAGRDEGQSPGEEAGRERGGG